MIDVFLAEALGGEVKGYKILDIGSGNGMIANYFTLDNEVTGVDVRDRRHPEYTHFNLFIVDSAKLPFSSDEFDIVISHHVIEHIPEQVVHLQEIHRVLKDDGLGYLGTPNKSSPFMEGHVGNNLVLNYYEMIPLFEQVGFNAQLISLRLAARPQDYYGEIKLGRYMPSFILNWLIPYFPSHYFLLRKRDSL